MRTGAVLSGGSSTRFGSDKGLARFGREPMVRLIVSAMKPMVDEVVVAVAKGRGEDYSSLFDNDVIVVEDEREGIGPLLGLKTALRAASGEYVVVCPCDTPLVRPGLLAMILEQGTGRDGAVPRIRGYLEPLHASYRRETCMAAFDRVLADGMRRPKDAYTTLDLAIVEEEQIMMVDPWLESFTNINTRQDLQRARARLVSP